MVFTSVRERSRYERSGMWGLAEVKEWLGSEADYAVIQPAALRFYRGREPYREVLGRLDELIARNFILAGTVKGIGSDTFLVYRRIRAAAGAEPPGQHPPNG